MTKRAIITQQAGGKFGVPNGIRTRVLALKGPRPGPLDDGDPRGKPDECSMVNRGDVMVRRVAAALLVTGFMLVPTTAPVIRAATTPLQGAWQVQDGRAGLYIFAGTHYSLSAAA